jgi:murein L,D-transpeptidase YafK
MRRIWRGLLIFFGLVIVISLAVMLLIRLTPNPPVEKIELARITLSEAAKNKADTYSRKLYSEAKSNYDSAMLNWERQNQRFIFFRDYDKVIQFADIAVKKANQASENSLSNSSNLKIKIRQKITHLNDLITDNADLFTTYPLTSDIRKRISKGKQLLKEAEIAFSKGQYLPANRKLTDAEYLITESFETASSSLKDYFRSYSTWKNWVDRTISESKKNRDYAIIVDKYSRKCFVYLSGSKKYEFTAELGKNWVGDKRVRGDKATPEGMYKVTKKFEGSKTKYHKALLLDYPNEEDKVKFNAEIARGSLPRSAKIGGLIEIHGDGGKGIDWTEGCVALTNDEIDLVYKISKVGTPVTIVGSMKELNNLDR